MNVQGKKVVIVGAARSGVALADVLSNAGAHITLNDAKQTASWAYSELAELGRVADEIVLGHHEASVFTDADLVVVSPGVPELPVFGTLQVPVISEIEAAYGFVKAPILAVTGTNGKSTVTTWLGRMVSRSRPAFVGGNLGDAMSLGLASEANRPEGAFVLELSSFQLERIHDFHAHIAVFLNISDDHLDRHGTLEKYLAAKAEIFRNQRPADFAVVPFDDQMIRQSVKGGAKVITFGLKQGDVRVTEDTVTADGFSFPIARLKVKGVHNLLNAAATIAAARAFGVSDEVIASELESFQGLPHRMQTVLTVNGVEYIDDSKATNVGATVAALGGLTGRLGRVVLIAGGVDKGGSYLPIRESLVARDGNALGRGLVLLGQAASLIESAFAGSGLALAHAADMEEAVQVASTMAQPGDVVLLAPACASFDQFKSYAHRGDVFAEQVRALAPETIAQRTTP